VHRFERSVGQAWWWGAGAWLVLRIVTTSASLASAAWVKGGATVGVPGYAPPELTGAAGRLAGVWLRSDALWYLKVASAGYGTEPGSYAFLPAFPQLVRVLRPLFGGNELYAGLFAANVACILGFVLLYRFVETLLDGEAARSAVVGLALLPTAFFLVVPYGEPVLLAAGAGALVAAQRGQFEVAAAAAAVAALSRPFGALLALPLAGLAWGRGWRAWIAPAGSAVGAAVWLTLAGAGLNDPLGALHVQAMWQRSPGAPWTTIVHGVRSWWAYRATGLAPYFLLDVAAVVFALALTAGLVVLLRRRNVGAPVAAGLAGYAALTILLPLSNPFPGRPLLSFPRFLLALFPAFAACSLIPRRLRLPLAVASAGGLAWATAMFVAARPIF
jgi:hypothetical protein